MSGSSSEREIRDYAAERLRVMVPEARIIHELVVGGCRADLAAVEPERITLVEIKSERDTLKRLPEQVRQFTRAAHGVVVIAHEHWFDQTPYNNGAARFVPGSDLRDACEGSTVDIWGYPEVADRPNHGSWHLNPWRFNQPQPHAARLLELCWRAELLEEAVQHRIAAGARATMPWLIREMSWMMSGREVAQAVCRQLRMRRFPEADAACVADRVARLQPVDAERTDALRQAGDSVGHSVLAAGIGISDRTLRSYLGAERRLSNKTLASAATVLRNQAAEMIELGNDLARSA